MVSDEDGLAGAVENNNDNNDKFLVDEDWGFVVFVVVGRNRVVLWVTEEVVKASTAVDARRTARKHERFFIINTVECVYTTTAIITVGVSDWLWCSIWVVQKDCYLSLCSLVGRLLASS